MWTVRGSQAPLNREMCIRDRLEEMTYKEVDGLLYPQIEMPDETEDLTKLGKYGRMAMSYLKENEPARYKTLMRFGDVYKRQAWTCRSHCGGSSRHCSI